MLAEPPAQIARGPAQAVLLRRRAQPAGRLPGAPSLAAIRQRADQQDAHLREMSERIAELQLELAKLQAEKEKAPRWRAEHDRSTAKGRPYEEAVFDAVDAIAAAPGRRLRRGRRPSGAGGARATCWSAIDGCAGPARGRIVFEAKNSQVLARRRLAELDEAMAQRDADYAVWVVPSRTSCRRARTQLREVNGDKLFVVYDPEDGSRLGARGRLQAGPRARADGARRGRRARRAALPRGRARAAARWRTCAGSRQQLDRRGGRRSSRRAEILDAMAARVRAHLSRSSCWSPQASRMTRRACRRRPAGRGGVLGEDESVEADEPGRRAPPPIQARSSSAP